MVNLLLFLIQQRALNVSLACVCSCARNSCYFLTALYLLFVLSYAFKIKNTQYAMLHHDT